MDVASEVDYGQMELRKCLANGQWEAIVKILTSLFRKTIHMGDLHKCVRAEHANSLLYDICRTADSRTLQRLLEVRTLLNKHYLEFTIALCDACSMESLIQHFQQSDYILRIALARALTSTRQIGKLAQLLRYKLLDVYLLDWVVGCGQCDETIMAWVTCCTSDYVLDHNARVGLHVWPCCQSMETLLTFGIWPNRLLPTHPYYIALKNSFRCQLLKEIQHPSFDLPGLLEKIDAKPREERLTDAVYMCIYMNRLELLKQILKKYSLNIFAFPFALHWAVRSRELVMVKFVSKKCPGQMNSLCELGFTPLILAVFTEKIDIVNFLLRSKSIITSVPSRHKLTAYDYAREFPEIEQLLRSQ